MTTHITAASRSASWLLAGVLLAAVPLRAQTLDSPEPAPIAGPIAVPSPLTAARLAPVAMRDARTAVAAPGRVPSADFSPGTGPSKPHLYSSIPLSAVLGLAGMIVGYGVGLGAFGCQDEAPGCDHAPDDFEYTLGFAGTALGAATGAHLGGLRHDSKGSFWATVGGAAVGSLPLLVSSKDTDNTGAYVGSLVGGTAGAVLVDYLVRRARH